MRVLAFFLLLLLLVPVNPYGAESKAGGVIDFGWIDVPFKANFTISFVLSSNKMYIKTDSPRIIAPSQVTGNVGDTVVVNVTLVVPVDAKPRDYVLHIYVTPGLVGSVEAQVSYQVRFIVKGIDVASFNPKPDSIFLAIYNSYPKETHIRARVYMDNVLLRELEGDAPAKGYAIRNITGDFEGRHNFTVIARSSSGYDTRYVYNGPVLPVDVNVNVDVRTNGKGIEVVVTLENRGRDVNVIIEAKARSDEGNDTRSQQVSLVHGDKAKVTILLHVGLPAFVYVRVIAVVSYQRTFWVSGKTERTFYSIIDKIIYGLIIASVAVMIPRIIRKPKGKFSAERVLAIGVSSPILAIRKKEVLYPPSQALTILSLPQVTFHGDGIIISEKVYAIRSTQNLKVYVIGTGDGNKGLELARKVRTKLMERGADILTEIPPDDPIIDEIIEAVFGD